MEDAGSSRQPWVEDALSQHEGALVAYASRLLGDGHRARDAVQETFLRLCSQRPEQVTSLQNGHLRPWLFTVCRRIALDSIRKERRMTPTAEAVLDLRPGTTADPAAVAETRDDGSRALRAVGALAESQREVVELRFRHGLSYAEIAEITGHTVTNVGFLLHTAMKTLRAKLARDGGAL